MIIAIHTIKIWTVNWAITSWPSISRTWRSWLSSAEHQQLIINIQIITIHIMTIWTVNSWTPALSRSLISKPSISTLCRIRLSAVGYHQLTISTQLINVQTMNISIASSPLTVEHYNSHSEDRFHQRWAINTQTMKVQMVISWPSMSRSWIHGPWRTRISIVDHWYPDHEELNCQKLTSTVRPCISKPWISGPGRSGMSIVVRQYPDR